ncbi:MAG: flippase [Oscillospiraceae bacterium]|nr:flippase [Oscillospiraceae bacterium]
MNGEAKKIVSNTLWMIFDKVFILVLNLLVTVRIANYFGSSEYGNYQYAVSIVAILEIIVTFVDARVVKKRYVTVDSDLLVFNATICRAIFSAIAFLVGIIYIIIANRGEQFSIVLIVLLFNAIISNLRFGMTNRFEYLLKSKKTVIAADISSALSSVLQLIAVSFECSIVAISIIALISSVVNLTIITIQYRVEFKSEGKNHFDKQLVAEMIKESLPLAIAASCATLYTRCDSVMLGALMTTAEVGIYSISVKLISVVQIALAPIRESVYPKLIQLHSNNLKEYEKMYVQISSLMTWIYIVGVLFSYVVLPFAFTLLNEEYAEAYPVFQIHVLGTFFMYNAALRAGHFTLINRGKILTYSQIVSVIANIILNYVGITMFGMYGAAIATVLTQAISLFFSNLFFGKDGREVFWWQVKALNPMYAIQLLKSGSFPKARSKKQ